MSKDDNEKIPKLIIANIPRQVLADLRDQIIAQFQIAHESIRDHTGLHGTRLLRGVGFVRFLMIEEKWEIVTEKYGGIEIEGGSLPEYDGVIYQPYRFFGSVLLGFASHIAPGEMPLPNMSRANASQLNAKYGRQLDMFPLPQENDKLFALMLASRDSTVLSNVNEISIAVPDPSCGRWLFCEPIGKFLDRYSDDDAPKHVEDRSPQEPLAKLKKWPKPYTPPEHAGDEKEENKSKKD